MAEKLHALEEDNQQYKHKLESQREEFERLKDEIIKSKEESLKETEERLSAESTRKVSELKKKAEQKISQIKKQLTSQLEEKEQMITALQTSLEELKSNETSGKKHIETLEEKTKSLEDALIKLKEEQAKQLEQILNNERLEKEKSLVELKVMYEDKLTSLQSDTVQQGQLREAESALHEIEAKLKEAEERNGDLVAEINRLRGEINEKDAQLDQHQATIKEVQNPSQSEMKVECSSVQQTKSVLENELENHSPTQEVDDDDDSLQSLKNKLSQVKNEREKIQKDFIRLQKDMRSLRKEHEHDLEYMKKELLEENEKKLKLELEDLEMKHNSAMKQIMREFNTQMSLKEKELDTAVKEAIAKAQNVEEELISSHREEASQLRMVISQKEDDLHKTVQKYEQVIQILKKEKFDSSSHYERFDLFLLVVTDPGLNASDAFSEPTEMEYLRKVLFEYMMGRETKTMAKVITSMLKFPPDQAQKVLDKEDSKTVVSIFLLLEDI
uniref:GRIP domain-containing protein n=1 Tax=Amphilophus citrinellus TaxID=61819 RepID=A0A3Q0SZF2_AMPCI